MQGNEREATYFWTFLLKKMQFQFCFTGPTGETELKLQFLNGIQ